MSENLVKIHNSSTGKDVLREMTEEEKNDYQQKLTHFENLQAKKIQQQALKDSANAKLLALGLSPEEVAAITGA